MGSTIEKQIYDLIFKTFKQKVYDSKEPQKWGNDSSEREVFVLNLDHIVSLTHPDCYFEY